MAELVVKKSNEIIDKQAQMIVSFLKDLGLPHENIIAEQSQRAIIGDNLNSLISAIPAERRKDAHYLSKFVVGAGVGLFDYSLNAIWNEVVLNLRKKAVMYGLDIFYDAAVSNANQREYYSKEEHIASLKDSILLDVSRKLELISDTTYKKLKHILDMRNDIGISHPTNYSIKAFELLSYLENCVEDVLNDNPTEAALQVQAFISNLKKQTTPVDANAQKSIEGKLMELPTHLCGSLVRTVFGIYVAADTDAGVRKNISLIAPKLWNACRDEVKFKLGIVLEGYNVNLHQAKHELGGQFFEIVKGQSYRSPSERAINIDRLVNDLLDKHNGWDNFHHEPPVAAELASFIPDQASIIKNNAQRMYTIVMLCRIGNGVSYNSGVSPGAKKYYNSILALAGDTYAPHVIACMSSYEIEARLGNKQCREHAAAALTTVKANVINARLIECLDYLIDNIVSKPSCVDGAEIKKLSEGYVTW